MKPKSSLHVIQGMQKDPSKSKLSKEFAFDAKNIRITAREDNSLLSVTNEKGNKFEKSINGNYVGHCIINNQLVLFTTTETTDGIFLYDSELSQILLYSGNLNFSVDNPLETLGVYENEDIQKVYWVDDINQPRVINIKAPENIRSKWLDSSFDFIPELALQESVSVEAISKSSLFAPGVIQYAFSYYNKYGQESNIFDVTPLCYLAYNNRGANPEEIIKDRAFKIKINNLDTIFDYIRIYSIHRTSLNSTPTVKRIIDLPISISEETTEIKESVLSYNIANNYTIGYYSTDFKYDSLPIDNIKYIETIVGNITETKYSFAKSSTPVDYNNQYLILYDENAVEKERIKVIGTTFYIITEKAILPGSNKEIIKRTLTTKDTNTTFIIIKIQYNNTIPSIEYIDNGTLGETIDPTQLLYIGGEDIIAGTITQKDNTLFLGNIKLNKLSISQNIKNNIRNTVITPQRRYLNINTEKELLYPSDYTSVNEDSYYRAGEHYRVGIQFQHKSGKWSEPIYITDYTTGLNQRPTVSYGQLSIPSFSYYIDKNISSELISSGYKKMRGLVVFPEKHESKVLAQGMLCPTVFNTKNRKENNPYSQSSWFLRPNIPIQITENYFDKNNGEGLDYESNLQSINKGSSVEFRHGKSIITGANRGSEIQNNTEYKIDQSILNFYSPEFLDEYINLIKLNNIQFRIVGIINFTSNYGDIDIITKTPNRASSARGFIHYTSSNLDSGDTSLISGLYYNDGDVSLSVPIDDRYYMVYPWHKSGSLNNDSASKAQDKSRTQSAILEKKKISNIKFSKFNTWIDISNMWKSFGGNKITSLANGISNIEYFNSDQIALSKIKSNIKDVEYNYYGNIDSLLTNEDSYNLYYGSSYGDKELLEDKDAYGEPVRIKYKTSPHLVFKLNNSYYGDEIVLPNIDNVNSVNGNSITETEETIPEYIGEEVKFVFVDPKDPEEGDLWIKEEIVYYNYYPNIPEDSIKDNINSPFNIIRVLKYDNSKWVDYYQSYSKDKSKKVYIKKDDYTVDVYYFDGRRIVGDGDGNANYKYALVWEFDKTINIIPTEKEELTVVQDTLNITQPKYPYLYLVEFYNDSIKNAFGGTSEDALKNNLWIPASDSIPLSNNTLTYKYGDTRYQRYDCLKTYAFTPEDENQVVEIASFMCETRVNMLGRYDKNIGNLSNLNADPTNFNLFNPVYSQKDNFFNYRILDSDIYKLDKFTNTITWSKEKHVGEEVDTWTNITMASTLDLDGTKGKVNKLITFKDHIFAFQDKGISNILFNSRVQIPVSDGVPIEISNGMKVEGNRYISDNIGCQNKNSILTTPSGVYFLDSETSSIYLLADGITNLSNNKGFSIWTKEVAKDSSFRTFYDKNNQDVYFTTEDYCLGYSEKLGQFISFYDYNDVSLMFNLNSDFYSIKNGEIYKHYAGKYNMFYGQPKPYSVTIISNDNPYTDKIFNTVEYIADLIPEKGNKSPFDTLKVWNEYQEGESTLVFNAYTPSSLKRKFRIWRANIPRDKINKLDRMRNPWLYIKLSNEKNLSDMRRMELHDIMVHYFE